jgi:hypothetical protein
MASFKNALAAAIDTTDISILTGAASVATTVIGMTVANITANQIKASVKLTSGATTCYLIKDAPIPVGGSLVAIGGDQKLVLEAADILKVVCDTANGADAIVSYLES